MTTQRNIINLGHPLFLVSVTVLILNDWVLKQYFNNFWTGKLSDFAGLFAFPFLISTITPRWKKYVHILTALLFIFWKSSLSEPLIDFINYIGIPVYRTIDVADNIALVSLLASYYGSELNGRLIKRRHILNAILVLSVISFVATTLPPTQQRKYSDINKDYHFDISKHELVSRLNAVQMKEVLTLSKLSGGRVDFDEKKNIFHYHGSTDTLALLLDYSKLSELDTIVYKTSLAEIVIHGDEKQSTLTLLSIYRIVPAFKEKEYRDKAIRTFEKQVVKKINRFPKQH